MTTTNPYLEKCAVLAAKSESAPKKEEGPEATAPPEKPPTVASIAKTPGTLKDLHLDKKNPTLNDIAKPY